MKGIDIFCTSQASTAICLSLDQSSSCISPNTIQLGNRAIDRNNPIITDSSRFPSTHPKPQPHPHHPQNTLKNSSSKTKGRDHKNKASSKKLSEHVTNNYSSNPISSILRTRSSCARPPPAGSSRYLLSEPAFLDNVSSDCHPVLALPPPIDGNKPQFSLQRETETKPASSDQVVVLKVSLHCKGCEGKVKKHLSRMEGVTSFNIDFAAKKVTIVGDVAPLSVLKSVSKVKNAQFWPASASAVGSGIAETKKKSLI